MKPGPQVKSSGGGKYGLFGTSPESGFSVQRPVKQEAQAPDNQEDDRLDGDGAQEMGYARVSIRGLLVRTKRGDRLQKFIDFQGAASRRNPPAARRSAAFDEERLFHGGQPPCTMRVAKPRDSSMTAR